MEAAPLVSEAGLCVDDDALAEVPRITIYNDMISACKDDKQPERAGDFNPQAIGDVGSLRDVCWLCAVLLVESRSGLSLPSVCCEQQLQHP